MWHLIVADKMIVVIWLGLVVTRASIKSKSCVLLLTFVANSSLLLESNITVDVLQ